MNSSKKGSWRFDGLRREWAMFWAIEVILVAGVVKVVGASLAALHGVLTV
jgi:hypothetical protein